MSGDLEGRFDRFERRQDRRYSQLKRAIASDGRYARDRLDELEAELESLSRTVERFLEGLVEAYRGGES